MKVLLLLFLIVSCETDTYNDADKSISGVVIARNCFERYSNIKILYQASITEGMNCLNEINSKIKDEFLGDFIKKKRTVHIDCDPSHFGKRLVDGRARSPELNNHDRSEILLNVKSSDTTEYKKRIIFHELLHLSGRKHFEDVDYAYGCEFTCFASKRIYADETVKFAKSLCRGDFEDIDNLAYLRSLGHFLVRYRSKLYALVNLNEAHEKIDPIILGINFINIMTSNGQNYMGYLYAQMLLSKKRNQLNKKQIEYLQRIERVSHLRHQDLDQYAKLTLQHLFSLHFSKEYQFDVDDYYNSFMSIKTEGYHLDELDIYDEVNDLSKVLVDLVFSKKK